MDITISTHQLKLLLQEAAALGAKTALVKSGWLKPYLKKSEAFRKYGRQNVEQWIDEGLVSIRKDGDHSAAWRIDRLEIEAIVMAMEFWRHF